MPHSSRELCRVVHSCLTNDNALPGLKRILNQYLEVPELRCNWQLKPYYFIHCALVTRYQPQYCIKTDKDEAIAGTVHRENNGTFLRPKVLCGSAGAQDATRLLMQACQKTHFLHRRW